jgi:hypothetical protein
MSVTNLRLDPRLARKENPMARSACFVAALLAILPVPAAALEFKNIRSCYGPNGATRPDNKFLPRDLLYITYDIEGLKADEKTGNVVYVTLLEVFNASTKELIFRKEAPVENALQFGGNRLPGDLLLNMGIDKAAGQYVLRMTVQDRIAKETKSFTYPFELLKKDFGIVGLQAPIVGVPGGPYILNFAMTEFKLDANKNPKGKIEMKITDETGKLIPPVLTNSLPESLPARLDLSQDNLLQWQFPLLPNRPGRFHLEVTATDDLAKKSSTVRYTLNVLDVNSLSK